MSQANSHNGDNRPSARKPRRLRWLIVSAIVIVIGLTVITTAFFKGSAVRHHCQAMESALASTMEIGPEDGEQGAYIQKFEYHRDKLVELGFLGRRELPLQFISYPSLIARRMYEDLSKVAESHRYSYFEIAGYEPETPDVVTIWDMPDRIDALSEIVTAYDQPVSNGVSADQSAIDMFVGTWITPENEVSYVISADSQGTLTVEIPQNETWRFELRNMRLTDGRLMFDAYSYTPAQGGFKSPANSSGEHPFSGVRCQVVLEVQPADPDHMTVSGGGIADMDAPETVILSRAASRNDLPSD